MTNTASEKYYLTHIDFSFPDEYQIHDASQEKIVYRAHAKPISFGKTFQILDEDKKVYLEIHHKMISNKAKYDFKREGAVVSNLVQPFDRFSRLEADGAAGKFILEAQTSGSGRSHTWLITDSAMKMQAEICRVDLTTARYSIAVCEDADLQLMLAFAIVLCEILGFGPVSSNPPR